MAGRILIIRGGAIGDFILTLPAIGLIRENLPAVRIEILGYPDVTRLALSPRYADAVHSIEYAPLARFFSRKPTLDPEMISFFTGFQQIISYLYDPDGILDQNLRAAGVKNLIHGAGRLGDDAHAVLQLARPLEKMAFFLEDTSTHFQPDSADEHAANITLANVTDPFIAIHPGSGGKMKNWPAENWLSVIETLRAKGHLVLLVGGEADEEALRVLQQKTQLPALVSLPLRTLGAVLARSRFFLGHDSGISHLAAATGTRCLLLFGPTDPDIWAPKNRNVAVIWSENRTIAEISVERVLRAIFRVEQASSLDPL